MTTSDIDETITQRDRRRSRRDTANVLAATSAAGVGFAYLTMFAVLGETAYADKLENGELPAGFDPSGGQAAMIASVVAMLGAVVAIGAAVRIRVTWVVGVVATLGSLAALLYVPLAFISWLLAF